MTTVNPRGCTRANYNSGVFSGINLGDHIHHTIIRARNCPAAMNLMAAAKVFFSDNSGRRGEEANLP